MPPAGSTPTQPRPTNLTPNEQLTHISLWALQAAPLLMRNDLSQMDDFTTNLPGNREVLSTRIRRARRRAARGPATGRKSGRARCRMGRWRSGCSIAPEPMPVTVKFADIGVGDLPPIRFPWTQTDMGAWAGSGKEYTATVPRHGVVLVKIGKAKGATNP